MNPKYLGMNHEWNIFIFVFVTRTISNVTSKTNYVITDFV